MEVLRDEFVLRRARHRIGGKRQRRKPGEFKRTVSTLV
jgi:hypothetical protein